MLLEGFSTIFDRPEKIKKLREYILSLAVRGKLVKQDENDEPASILLERIREEKERLVKEKKIKKEKPFEEISKEEKAFEIPENWEWTRLSQISNYIKAGGDKPKDFSTIKTEEYIIPVIANGKTNKGITGYTKVATENNMCITVSGRGTIGYSCIRKEPFCPIVRLIVINPSIYINISYLNYAFKYFIEEGTGTSIQQLTVPMIKPKVIPIPPLSEQKRIVDKLDYLMEFCDKLEVQLEKKVKYGALSAKSALNSVSNCSSYEELEEALRFIIDNFKDLTLNDGAVGELKNAILSLAVKGKLVPQDDSDEPASVLLDRIENEKEKLVKEKKIKKEKSLPEIDEDEIPYEIPKSWKWVRLKDIGYNHGQKKPNSKFSYIDVGSINKELGVIGDEVNIIEAEDAPSRARKIVKSGTILYSTVRPYLLNIAIVDRKFEYEPIASTAFAIIHPYSYIDNRYVYYYLRSTIFVKYVESQMVGMAYPAINDEKLFKGLIPLPPLNEQKRIVEKVEGLMKLCDELELRIEKSKKYSEKLMESILKDSLKA